MIIEFDEDFNKLDDITKQILLDIYYDDLIESGYSDEEAKITLEMIKNNC